MGQIIFTEFELQVLETAKILGGKGNVTIQNQCNNSADGCGAGSLQNQCSNSAQCMCYITQNCETQERCLQVSCL